MDGKWAMTSALLAAVLALTAGPVLGQERFGYTTVVSEECEEEQTQRTRTTTHTVRSTEVSETAVSTIDMVVLGECRLVSILDEPEERVRRDLTAAGMRCRSISRWEEKAGVLEVSCDGGRYRYHMRRPCEAARPEVTIQRWGGSASLLARVAARARATRAKHARTEGALVCTLEKRGRRLRERIRAMR